MPRPWSLSGSYPRREDLVKATWNLDKGLLSITDVAALRLEQARELVALQERLGAEAVTDGNLSWQDAFRGVVENNPAFQVGGVTRLFETNRFYRQPILVGTPQPNPKALQAHFLLDSLKPKAPKKAILPSPYWLVRAAKVETNGDADNAGPAIAEYLNGVARWLEGAGYRQVQFNEALLFYEKTPDLKLAQTLLETTLKGLKTTAIVNFSNGNAAPHLAWLKQLPAAATVGIDFIETFADDLPAKPLGRPLLAAVVDAQESLLESGAEVERLATTIERRLSPKGLTLTHTWDLQFLPATLAPQKIETLSKVATRKVVA